jgi:hypothetical protein
MTVNWHDRQLQQPAFSAILAGPCGRSQTVTPDWLAAGTATEGRPPRPLRRSAPIIGAAPKSPAEYGGAAICLRRYGFGKRRFALPALLTLIALLGRRSCGVVITKFSGHTVTLRSSATLFADTLTSRSTSTCILAGKPPSATCNAAMLLGLYRIWAPCRLPTTVL